VEKALSDQEIIVKPAANVKFKYTQTIRNQWPTKEWFKSKSDEALRNLRIKKVEWTTSGLFGGQVVGFKITLSDGHVSEEFGKPGALNNSSEFRDADILRSIKIGGDNTVEAIQFCGKGGEILISAGNLKNPHSSFNLWKNFTLNDGESFVGIQSMNNDLDSLGFVILKQ